MLAVLRGKASASEEAVQVVHRSFRRGAIVTAGRREMCARGSPLLGPTDIMIETITLTSSRGGIAENN